MSWLGIVIGAVVQAVVTPVVTFFTGYLERRRMDRLVRENEALKIANTGQKKVIENAQVRAAVESRRADDDELDRGMRGTRN